MGRSAARLSEPARHLGPVAADPEALSAPLPRCPAAPLSSWYLWVDEIPRPGWANMAIDHSLLDRAEGQGESWLRLYRWDPHCLSFGRHEPATRRYDIDRIRELGLDTVRRPTGGRAVWHARELTYAVVGPSSRFGSLKAAYLEIHRMLGDALRRLGAPVSLAPSVRTAPVDAGACFNWPAGGELMVAGRKVVGSAQYRQGTALLQHGSILLEDDQRLVLAVTRGAPAPDTSLEPAPKPAMESRAPLGRRLEGTEVAEAVADAAVEWWPGRWERIAVPGDVLAGASRHYRRYRSTAWTWAR